MQHYLDFEKELALLDGKANELRSTNSSQNEEKQKNGTQRRTTSGDYEQDT